VDEPETSSEISSDESSIEVDKEEESNDEKAPILEKPTCRLAL
jgi:hypothetical protein